ncbi:hypothetical protein B0H63DRAFT_496949 [Podospora didyma]|uniref:protein-histidine N-methyltransferase n=1 Tax=Podospora didyma TaxID=330526 RepID=A0AAE0KAB7_9PEZI|nr:hypothetical protein B0H63DRAFT_496949 [Podospora didyma]
MSTFSFSFAGDDIDDDGQVPTPAQPPTQSVSSPSSASAFPVQGKPLLPPTRHSIDDMLAKLPSKIAFGLLSVDLDGGRSIQLPRRELWDVRLQLMAEEEESSGVSESEPGLGEHDVKTGIYEGGFKSWESSVDLVKVLASENIPQALSRDPCILMELGCGTALPSLALFQWALDERKSSERPPLVFTLADYNPTVLYLVTLPNFLLTWALQRQGDIPILEEAFASEDELELTAEVLEAFKLSLASNQITLSFVSGAWSPEFVDLLYPSNLLGTLTASAKALVLGAETIYSPFALETFAITLLSVLERERCERPSGYAAALIGAKRLYFGVGGSLDDFTDRMKGLGATVETLREETDGVRRGVIRCILS